MSRALTLHVYRDGQRVHTQTVEGELIKIGRMASAHLRLDDPKVSRIHAMIEVAADGTVSVIDMGSAQGTLVDGKPISKVTLASGMRFTMGDTTVEVVFDGASRTTAAAAPASAPAPEEPATASAPKAEPPAADAAPAPAQEAPSAPEAPAPEVRPTRAAKPKAKETKEAKAPKEAAPKPKKAASARPAPSGDLPLPPPWPREGLGRPMALQVEIFWGDQPLEAGAFYEETSVTLGGGKATFAVYPGDLPSDPYPLARKEGEQWVVSVPPGATGGVIRDGELRSFSELGLSEAAGFDLPLDASESAYVQLGNLRITFCFRPRRKPVMADWTQSLDYDYLNVLAVAFFLVAASVVGFVTTDPHPPSNADYLFANRARFTRLLLEPPERVANNPFLQRLKKLEKPAGEKTVQARGEEAKMGKPDAPQVARRAAPQGIPNEKEQVANQGILAILGKGSGGLSTVLGSSGLGGELKGAIGGLTGNAVGDAHGFGGLGLRGAGPGGGAVGETVSVGAIGTRGRGGGSSNFGAGVGGLGAKGSAEVKIDTSAVSITGTIDRELIRRVIQANHGKFRYCYENELVRNPRLSGRIAVRFQIDAQGKVTFANVASTTMNNAAVENCVVARIRGLTFPMPQGGGVALVTYPFLFTPPGE